MDVGPERGEEGVEGREVGTRENCGKDGYKLVEKPGFKSETEVRSVVERGEEGLVFRDEEGGEGGKPGRDGLRLRHCYVQ